MPRRAFQFCIVLLALAALYTVTSAWITVERIERLDAAGNATTQRQQVLSALHAFATGAVDIESSARGYALTGNDAYLQPFELARRQTPQRLDELRDLLRNEPKQLARIERLTALLAERIGISEHGIAQKRSAPDEPFAIAFGARGREASDEIRRIVEDVESDERHDLAGRKSVWQQELERARTTEAISALSSLTVITLSLWALLRLRRNEVNAEQNVPARSPASPPEADAGPVDFDALVDDAQQRLALLERSPNAASLDHARVERLREALTAARAGTGPADAHVVFERLGLGGALSALAHTVRDRHGCTVRESIEQLPSVSPSQAALLFRAASWAFDVICAQRPPGETGIGLAADGAHVVLRVESPARGAVAASSDLDDESARLSQQVAAYGGTWQWKAGDSGQGLTVTLPAPSRESEAIESDSVRA